MNEYGNITMILTFLLIIYALGAVYLEHKEVKFDGVWYNKDSFHSWGGIWIDNRVNSWDTFTIS